MNTETRAENAIRAVVEAYVEGMTFADETAMRRAFHPDCKIIGHYEGALEWASLDEFIDAIKGVVSQTPPTPTWTIEALDVTGDAASVKVIDDFMGMTFTDYLALLKIEGTWLIINKLYYLHA